MFVVNFDTLETVNLLDLVEQMLLEFLGSTDLEDFVGHDRPLGKLLAFLHKIALEDDDVLGERNQMLLFGASRLIANEQAALAADGAADVDDTINLGDLRCVLRTACLE